MLPLNWLTLDALLIEGRMISDFKHKERIEKIDAAGEGHFQSVEALMKALKALGKSGNKGYSNLQKFDEQIRGKKNA